VFINMVDSSQPGFSWSATRAHVEKTLFASPKAASGASQLPFRELAWLLILRKGRSESLSIMKNQISGNYLRNHRKKAGLTQLELGRLLGYRDEGPVSRHEINKTLAPLRTGLAYEAIFRVPVSEIFPELFAEIKQKMEGNLTALKEDLERRNGKGRGANEAAQKLMWLTERTEVL
jgi:transcriptional regulator with XRE-family HTH domain